MSYLSRNFEETFLDMVLQRCESISYPARVAVHRDVAYAIHSIIGDRVWIPVHTTHTALFNIVTDLLEGYRS